MDRALKMPGWVSVLYGAMAVGLVPWIGFLAASLPSRHVSHHWDLAWTGMDIGILAAVVATTLLALRRSGWVVISATVVFTLLMTDAWFDVLTARPGQQLADALGAAMIELPLAIVSLWLAQNVAKALLNATRR